MTMCVPGPLDLFLFHGSCGHDRNLSTQFWHDRNHSALADSSTDQCSTQMLRFHPSPLLESLFLESPKTTVATLAQDNIDESEEKMTTTGSDAKKAAKAYSKFKVFARVANSEWPINIINPEELHFESIQRILIEYLFYRFFEGDATVGKHKVFNSELARVYDMVCDEFHHLKIKSPVDVGQKGLRKLKESKRPLLANVLEALSFILPDDLVGANPLFDQDIERLQDTASPTPKGIRMACFVIVAKFLGARAKTW
jgi:hypothetical protein